MNVQFLKCLVGRDGYIMLPCLVPKCWAYCQWPFDVTTIQKKTTQNKWFVGTVSHCLKRAIPTLSTQQHKLLVWRSRQCCLPLWDKQFTLPVWSGHIHGFNSQFAQISITWNKMSWGGQASIAVSCKGQCAPNVNGKSSAKVVLQGTCWCANKPEESFFFASFLSKA